MSAAALMHDRVNDPPDFEPSLVPGFVIRVLELGRSHLFYYAKESEPHRRLGSVTVTHPYDRWAGQIEPGYVSLSQSQTGTSTMEWRALADCIMCATNFCDALNDGIAEKLERQQKEREEQRARWRREQEEERERRAKREREAAERSEKLQELLQWELEERFRLQRNDAHGRPMKATVFGTIKRVERGRLYSISEKGKSMSIVLSRITKFELRDPDNPKKYTQIWPEGE